MKKLTVLSILILALAAVLVACGGGEEEEMSPIEATATQIGDIERGRELFAQNILGNSTAGCITCHSLEPGVTIVGPSQHDAGFRAAQRVSGMSAEEYLRESIVDPNAYVVEGFQPNTMTGDFDAVLTEQEINDLVAYLLTLQGQ